MILPNYENAYIPAAKIYDYLLSSTHSIGKSKANFFREFGFDESNANFLEKSLLSIAQAEPVMEVKKTAFGTKYIIDGFILTPVDITVNVRTVWIIETDNDAPRFVTAHPLPKVK
jgi:hypothetical protein